MNARSLIPAAICLLCVLAACGNHKASKQTTSPEPTTATAPGSAGEMQLPDFGRTLAAAGLPTDQVAIKGGTPWVSDGKEALRPTLLVVNFATDSDDDLSWGALFSRMLEMKLHYAPRELFSMPSPVRAFAEFRHLHELPFASDSSLPVPAEDAVKVARVLGVERVATGRVEKRNDEVTVSVEVRDTKTSEVLSGFSVEGTTTGIPELMVKCATRIVADLGVEPDKTAREYLARPTPATGQAFRSALLLWEDSPSSPAAAALAWTRHYLDDPSFEYAKAQALEYTAMASIQLAIVEARRLHGLEPENGQCWIHLIELLKQAGRPRDVIEECRAFLRDNPNDLLALSLLQRAYQAIGRHGESIATAEWMVQLCAESWFTHSALAEALSVYGWAERGGDFWAAVPPRGRKIFPVAMDECAKELERAWRINPTNPTLLSQMAYNAGSQGRGHLVEKLCREAIEIEPDNYLAYSHLLWWYRPGYTNQHEKAVALCREAAEKNPNSPSMQWLMAEYLIWYIDAAARRGASYADFMNKAEFTVPLEQALEKTLKLEPYDNNRREQAAAYYKRKGNYQNAWRHYSQITDLPSAMRTHPLGEHHFWTDMAFTAARMKYWDKSLEAANRGLATFPCRTCLETLLMCSASAHHGREEYDVALSFYKQVAQLNSWSKAWACRYYADVVIEHRPEKQSEGFEYAKMAVATDPKDAYVRVVMAKYHLKRNEIELAREQIQAALMLDPNSEDAKKLMEEHPNVAWDE